VAGDRRLLRPLGRRELGNGPYADVEARRAVPLPSRGQGGGFMNRPAIMEPGAALPVGSAFTMPEDN
jgi:hypothetical protein